MKRFVVYVEVEDALDITSLTGWVEGIPLVAKVATFAVEPDDNIPGLSQYLSTRRYQRRMAAAKAQDDAIFAAGDTCLASVSSPYSYRPHRCGKPAKGVREVYGGEHAIPAWDIGPNPAIPVCGVHARSGYLSRYSPEA